MADDSEDDDGSGGGQQSQSDDLGIGHGYDLANVNVGAAYDATQGLGSGSGLTGGGADSGLGAQVQTGAPASSSSGGWSFSPWGAVRGGLMGVPAGPAGIALGALAGGYGSSAWDHAVALAKDMFGGSGASSPGAAPGAGLTSGGPVTVSDQTFDLGLLGPGEMQQAAMPTAQPSLLATPRAMPAMSAPVSLLR